MTDSLEKIVAEMRDELRPCALSADSYRCLILHWSQRLEALPVPIVDESGEKL